MKARLRFLLTAWFWRHRQHGYRRGLAYRCARCGGVEYDGTSHPRGMWVMAPWHSRFGGLFR